MQQTDKQTHQQSNPYNWPFPQRKDLMYLSNIPNKQKRSVRLQSKNLMTNDILGATIKNVMNTYKNHEYFMSTFDQPFPNRFKNAYVQRKSNYVDDIDGAKPRAVSFLSKRLDTNPLDPIYKLPSFPQVIICDKISLQPPRKFLRDTLKIEFYNQKKIRKERIRGLEKLQQEIEGSVPRNRIWSLKDLPDKFNVKDINNKTYCPIFKTNRIVDILNPVYKWRDNEKCLNEQYGKKQLKRILNPSYIKQKIQGEQSNSYNNRLYFLDVKIDNRKEGIQGITWIIRIYSIHKYRVGRGEQQREE